MINLIRFTFLTHTIKKPICSTDKEESGIVLWYYSNEFITLAFRYRKSRRAPIVIRNGR